MARRNLMVECAMAMVAGKKPPGCTLYSTQRRDGALSHTIECSTRHSLEPSARLKYSLRLRVYDPSERELADKTAD